MPTLLLTPRYTEDSQALWRAAGQLGWLVERVVGWRISDELREVSEPVLYVEALVAPLIAEQLGLRLLEAPVDWLPRLPEEYRKRDISLSTLREARLCTEPAFIKPPNDKSFPARVYIGSELPTGYDEDSPVLIADVVSWEVEYRCFILNRQIQTISIYLRNGQLQRENGYAAPDHEIADAESFLRQVLDDPHVDLPKACVVDVGILAGKGWAVVEQNSAWGAGIYGCDPIKVLEVIRHASERIA